METIIENVLDSLNTHLMARNIQTRFNDSSLLLLKTVFTHYDERAQVVDFHSTPFSIDVMLDEELYRINVDDKGKFNAEIVG